MDRDFMSQMAESLDAQPTLTVVKIISMLTDIYRLLMFGMDRREISQTNLDTLRKDIQDVIRAIVTSTDIRDSIRSTDEVTSDITQVRTQLDLAADWLAKGNRERFYICLNKTCVHLHATINHLQNKK